MKGGSCYVAPMELVLCLSDVLLVNRDVRGNSREGFSVIPDGAIEN